ncbi:uncharacterized protein DS421_16g534580 [Arachis hypogaea]|nr:uncharacterized protein DS421_16g534580 [Arachis hypogaea]
MSADLECEMAIRVTPGMIQQLLREEEIDFGAMMGSRSGGPGGGLPSHSLDSYASSSSMRRRKKMMRKLVSAV